MTGSSGREVAHTEVSDLAETTGVSSDGCTAISFGGAGRVHPAADAFYQFYRGNARLAESVTSMTVWPDSERQPSSGQSAFPLPAIKAQLRPMLRVARPSHAPPVASIEVSS